MFHTAEICTVISGEFFNKLFSEYKGKVYFEKTKNAYVICKKELNQFGISNLKVWRSDVGANYRTTIITCVVNLPKLAAFGARSNYTGLATEADIPSIKYAFSALMLENFPLLPDDIDAWNVKRLDYAINLDIGEELAFIYPELLNRGKPRARTTDRDTHNSSYSYGNKCWRYNIYCKKAEVEREAGDKYSIWNRCDLTAEEAIHYYLESAGILRVEIQCFKNELYRILKKYNAGSKRTLTALARNEIALDIIQDRTSDISPALPYIGRKATEERIRQSKHRQKTRQRMLDFVCAVSKARTHDRIAQLFSDNKRLVKNMIDSGINPVFLRETEIKHLQESGKLINEELEPFCRQVERAIIYNEIWRQ